MQEKEVQLLPIGVKKTSCSTEVDSNKMQGMFRQKEMRREQIGRLAWLVIKEAGRSSNEPLPGGDRDGAKLAKTRWLPAWR
jgi:hypothetical protein